MSHVRRMRKAQGTGQSEGRQAALSADESSPRSMQTVLASIGGRREAEIAGERFLMRQGMKDDRLVASIMKAWNGR